MNRESAAVSAAPSKRIAPGAAGFFGGIQCTFRQLFGWPTGLDEKEA